MNAFITGAAVAVPSSLLVLPQEMPNNGADALKFGIACLLSVVSHFVSLWAKDKFQKRRARKKSE